MDWENWKPSIPGVWVRAIAILAAEILLSHQLSFGCMRLASREWRAVSLSCVQP